MADNNYMGKATRTPLSTLADKCAERIMRSGCVRSVCMDPSGVVTVEIPEEAVPDDIVGTYTKAMGRLALWRQIEGDLRFEVGLRKAAPKAA